MESTGVPSRVVGLLLLVHLAVGLIAPFILLERLRGSAGLLANAASSPGLFRTAVLFLIVGSSMAIAVSVTAGPVLRRSSESAALALVALAVAGFVLQVADTGALMSILALSLLYAGFRDLRLVEGLFFGLKPAVLAVVVEAVIRIGRRAVRPDLQRAVDRKRGRRWNVVHTLGVENATIRYDGVAS